MQSGLITLPEFAIIVSQLFYGLFDGEDRGWEPKRTGDGRCMGGRSGKGGRWEF